MSFLKLPVDLIQQVNRDVPLIGSAPGADRYPADLVTDLMPIALTWPDEGTTKAQAGFRHMLRDFVIYVYVAPAGGVLETAPPIARTMDVLQVLSNAWYERINSEEEWVLDYGEESGYRVELNRNEPIRDSGWIMDLEWRPKEYHFGFRLWLPLMVRWGSEVGI